MQNIIAVIFDFDGTLAPDSTSVYLKSIKVDCSKFWGEEVTSLINDGWDDGLSYFYKLIELSNSGKIPPITKSKLASCGSNLVFYKDVESIFDRLRAYARRIHPDIKLEFYSISGGIGEVIRNSPIAYQFENMWAGEFLYDNDGKIIFPKRIINCSSKTKYIFHISKDIKDGSNSFMLNKEVKKEGLRVPLDQMIMVGDGYTDIPCFAAIKDEGGAAIGVYDKNEEYYGGFSSLEPEMVSTLVPVDYSPNSDLCNALMFYIENMAKKIKAQNYQKEGTWKE